MKNRVEIEMFVLREILKKIEKRDIEEKKKKHLQSIKQVDD